MLLRAPVISKLVLCRLHGAWDQPACPSLRLTYLASICRTLLLVQNYRGPIREVHLNRGFNALILACFQDR